MYKLCVFAGTTEGRELVELLAGQPAAVTACVATEYGEALLEDREGLTVAAGRLAEAEMEALFRRERFDLVVDATHPYAAEVTENIARACEAAGTAYLRLLRDGGDAPEGAVRVPDAAAAVDCLTGTEGNILLATGAKELGAFAPLGGERLYPRVLPLVDSLSACGAAGGPASHVIAMQGPFSRELNEALIRQFRIAYLVTKDGGRAGGFEEKAAAAKAAGARLILIRRPREDGLGYEDVLQQCREMMGCR